MENFWIRLSHLAGKHGLRTIIAYPTEGKLPEHIQQAGIETVIQDFPGSGWRQLLQCIRFLRRNSIRVIYFTDRYFSYWRYLAYRLAGVKVLVNHQHTLGAVPPAPGFRRWLRYFWRQVGPMSCDLQICVSPLVRQMAVQRAFLPEAKSAVVQNAIAPIAPRTGSRYAQCRFSIPENKRVCITVGRADPLKRIDFFIEVARHVVKTTGLDDVFFLHCGDGPELSRLDALVRDSGLSGHFLLCGYCADVPDLLCSSDIAFHSSRSEAFSLAILEYMSAGLPVLVPDIPTACQAVQDGETGLIYRDGDVVHAAELLVRLLEDAGLRRRMGGAARETVNEKYSIDRMNESFDKLMEPWLARVI